MTLTEKLLFEEDFADLPLGTSTGYPYTAEGEYHVVDRTMGRWTEATIHGSWNRSGAGNWIVLEEDGRHVMAHTKVALVGPPMLVTGSRFWGDYAFEAQVRPLSWEGACGLVVRYQDCRRYVALHLTRGEMVLSHHDHGARKRLASRGFAFDVDQYYTLRLECAGSKILVFVDGEQVLRAEEDEYLQGKVGVFAQAPARFAAVRLTTSTESRSSANTRKARWDKEEQELRAMLPRPALWKRIDTADFGTDRNLRFGDLDGDGQIEIVFCQRTDLADGNYPNITCITAVDLAGNILWQIGEPGVPYKPATSDSCIQVADIDGDGAAEVLFCRDLRLWIADGRTGEILRSMPTPRTRYSKFFLPGGWPYERILGDAIHICNLSGGAIASDILIKDRYKNIWAFDQDFNELWHHECVTGHFPMTYDIDGDGRDEVMAGYRLVDSDGTMLWELPIGDHQDAIAIGRFDPDRDEILIAMAAGEEGFVLLTAQGEILAKHMLGHVQKLAVANVRPDLPGLEYVTINFWGHPGITAVFDCKGQILTTFEPVPYASPLVPVNWAGDGSELLFLSAHPTDGGLLDGWGHRAVMFPSDGHPYICCTALDLTGDGRDELLTWDPRSLWIYKADAPLPDGPRYRPVRLPHRHESNYMAHVSVPRWET